MDLNEILKMHAQKHSLKKSSLNVIKSRLNKIASWALLEGIEFAQLDINTLRRFVKDNQHTLKDPDRYAISAAKVLGLDVDQEDFNLNRRSEPLHLEINYIDATNSLRKKIQSESDLDSDLFFAYLALGYGLKLSEILKLKECDILHTKDLRKIFIKIGHGSKFRTVEVKDEDHAFFVKSFDSMISKNVKYTTSDWRRIGRKLKAIGLGSSLQALRNAYVYNQHKEEGNSITAISKKIGHAQPVSTYELVDRLEKIYVRTENSTKPFTRRNGSVPNSGPEQWSLF